MKPVAVVPVARIGVGTCGECRYWLRDQEQDDSGEIVGECRRSPPTFTVVFVPEEPTPFVSGSSDWPSVADDAWCGEFSPKYGRQ